jgi:hypothetical protein
LPEVAAGGKWPFFVSAFWPFRSAFVFLVGAGAVLCCWVLHNLAHNVGEGIVVLSPLEILICHVKVVQDFLERGKMGSNG